MLIVRHLGTPNSDFNGCHCMRDPVLYRSMIYLFLFVVSTLWSSQISSIGCVFRLPFEKNRIYSFAFEDLFRAMFALIVWKGENLVNVYSLKRITSPRKELFQYKVGELVKAKFGSKEYEATILAILGTE